MLAVYQKEINGYKYSPMSYIFIAGFFAFIGIYTMTLNLSAGLPNFEYALNNSQMVLLILIPVLTMRVLAGERNQKTDQLLYCSVVSMHRIIIGKFLAAFTVFIIPVIAFVFYPLILSGYGDVHFVSAYCCLAALAFLGAAMIAIGVFISSLTSSQSTAAVVTFCVFLLSYMTPRLAGFVSSSPVASLFGYLIVLAIVCLGMYFQLRKAFVPLCVFCVGGTALSILRMIAPDALFGSFKIFLSSFALFDKFALFVYGVVKIPSLIYFLSLTILFLFLSVQSMEIRRRG